jgi:hypothetical protein
MYKFFICTKIVDVIIGDLFFRDDKQLENIDADDGEQNPADVVRKKLIEKQNEKKNAMKLFCKEDDAPMYTVTIKDILRFDLAMDYVGISLTLPTDGGNHPESQGPHEDGKTCWPQWLHR